jgi:hypothetical protein
MKWQPIETAPNEDCLVHLRGVWVYSATSKARLYFDICAGYLECGDFLSADGEDHGWRPEDYTHWMPLPAPPQEDQP